MWTLFEVLWPEGKRWFHSSARQYELFDDYDDAGPRRQSLFALRQAFGALV